MEWQQIVGFYQVANLGSLTRAAEATFRTQSALSQQISALEKEFGCLLFERIGKKKLVLTPAGERFLQFAQKLLGEHEQLVSEIKEIGRLHSGRLRIAAQFALLYYFFPEVVREYSQLFPHVQLTVIERAPSEVIDLVKTGEIDLGVAMESMVPKGLVAIRFRKTNTLLVTPSGHPLAGRKRVLLEDLARYPLILPPKHMKYAGHHLEQKFEALGIPYRISMEASNFFLSVRYVEMGLGIALCARGLGCESLLDKRFEIIPLDHIIEPDYAAVVVRKDKNLQPHQSGFVSLVFKKLANYSGSQAVLTEITDRFDPGSL
ncbi:MAG TPA: LysR family transcriptional regulator [Syntrophorhabdaceae bacterium]|nr:LysR family transcriptional regulator [Syntrophorhabdaceae bacterium]